MYGINKTKLVHWTAMPPPLVNCHRSEQGHNSVKSSEKRHDFLIYYFQRVPSKDNILSLTFALMTSKSKVSPCFKDFTHTSFGGCRQRRH